MIDQKLPFRIVFKNIVSVIEWRLHMTKLYTVVPTAERGNVAEDNALSKRTSLSLVRYKRDAALRTSISF